MTPADMPLDSILIPPRKRDINQDKANGLASSMAQNGLINPITLKDDGTLLAGLHRIEAAKILNWQTIPAIVIAGLDALQAELIEIDENLIRNDLSPLQQGEWLNRRDSILIELGQRSKQGDNRFTNGRGEFNSPLQTTAQLAANVGLSERVAQQRKQIARAILPQVKEVIYGTELEERAIDLLNIARLAPELQMAAARSILSPNGANQQTLVTIFSHESVEWYTPIEIIELARQVMGRIDLDPASSPEAQENVKAKHFYSEKDDGLSIPWLDRVWLNPPYSKTAGRSNQDIWAEKLISEYQKGHVTEAILLVKAALGYKWFEELWDKWPVCFARERLSFIKSNGDDEGESKQGTALFYFGSNLEKFIEIFGSIGRITTPDGRYITRQ